MVDNLRGDGVGLEGGVNFSYLGVVVMEPRKVGEKSVVEPFGASQGTGKSLVQLKAAAYRKLLGVKPRAFMPNFYEILGVDLFESDVDVIHNAADRRMAFLRDAQNGVYAEVVQLMLNEISSARVSLSNPQHKAQYDANLRGSMAVKVSPAVPANPIPASPVADPVPEFNFEPVKRVSRDLKNVLIAVGCGVGFVVVLLFGIMTGSSVSVDEPAHVELPPVEEQLAYVPPVPVPVKEEVSPVVSEPVDKVESLVVAEEPEEVKEEPVKVVAEPVIEPVIKVEEVATGPSATLGDLLKSDEELANNLDPMGFVVVGRDGI